MAYTLTNIFCAAIQRKSCVYVAEPFAAVGRFVQPVALHHRAEAAVEQQDAFVEYLFDRFSHFLTISISNNRLQFFPVTKMRRVAAS